MMQYSRVFKPKVFRSKESDDWKAIHHLADTAAPKVQREFIRVANKARKDVSKMQLRQAYRANNIGRVLSIVSIDFVVSSFADSAFNLLSPLLHKSARQAYRRLRGGGSYDESDKYASLWLNRMGARFVTSIGDNTENAIRSVMIRAFTSDLAPHVAADLIASSVGLTPRQANALYSYRQRLIENGIKLKKVSSSVEAYRKKLLRYRGNAIARTETITASSMGRRVAWAQGEKGGVLTGMAIEWIVTPDDRLCVRCKRMKGKTIPVDLDAVFEEKNESGDVVQVVQSPALHTLCRCAIGLVKI